MLVAILAPLLLLVEEVVVLLLSELAAAVAAVDFGEAVVVVELFEGEFVAVVVESASPIWKILASAESAGRFSNAENKKQKYIYMHIVSSLFLLLFTYIYVRDGK